MGLVNDGPAVGEAPFDNADLLLGKPVVEATT